MSRVFEELGIPDKWKKEFTSWEVEYHEDSGSSGEMPYGYYFYVPEEADEEFLKFMEWEVGGCIEVSQSALESYNGEED